MAPPAAKEIGSNPMDRAHTPARSDKLTSIELATEHMIGDHAVALIDRSPMDVLRRIVEAL